MNPTITTSARTTFILVFVAMLVSGCSSSSDTSSGGPQLPADTVGTPIDEFDQASADTDIDTDMGDDAQPPADAVGEMAGDLDSTIDSTQNTNDSLPQATTQVKFDITVPAFVSNELQVGLVWGEKDLKATWVGDEFWTVLTELETNTENTLTITFYDNNGNLVLGTYEENYQTGFNDAESYQIRVDQFNTTQPDDDGDGFSNLAEQIAGTDPFTAESELVDVSVDQTVGSHFWFSIGGVNAATYHESQLQTFTLPILVNEATIADNRPHHYQSTTRDIAISAEGNGTYSRIVEVKPGQDQPSGRSAIGTRSVESNTVSWSGTNLVFGSSIVHNSYVKEAFTTSNTTIERELVQHNSGTATRKSGPIEDVSSTTEFDYKIFLDLDSMDSNNTCAVLRGRFSQTFESFSNGTTLTKQTLSRSSTNDNWVWTSVSDGEVTRGEAIILDQRFYCNFQL